MVNSKILVIGSLNVDIIMRTSRLPRPGETITATSSDMGFGGKGANQAIACARALRPCSASLHTKPLTIDVGMIGAVGSDANSLEYLQAVAANGVNVDGIKVHQGRVSGTAVVIVSEATGENHIIVTPGANELVKPETFTSLPPPVPDLVILQLEIPLETVLQVISTARKLGIDVLLNPAPAPARLLQGHGDVLKGLAHLVMNETEASILSGEGGGSEGPLEEESLKRIFKKFKALGVRNTIVTLGARGVCYSTGGGNLAWMRAVKVKEVVDTTAAGDTFVGYYAVEVVKGKRDNVAEDLVIRTAVLRANRAASRTVQKAGASSSIPWMDEVDHAEDVGEVDQLGP